MSLDVQFSALKANDFSPEQPSKALRPIAVTESGIMTEANLEQPSNALLPMAVTELWIVTDDSLAQL